MLIFPPQQTPAFHPQKQIPFHLIHKPPFLNPLQLFPHWSKFNPTLAIPQNDVLPQNKMQQSALRIVKLLLDEHNNSHPNQHQSYIIQRTRVNRGPRHQQPRNHSHHHRHPRHLHEPDGGDHSEQHEEAAGDHNNPLENGRYDHFGRGEEDGQSHTAQEDELMRHREVVGRFQLVDLGVDVPEQQSGDKFQQFTLSIVLLHKDRSDDNRRKVESQHAHLAAFGLLPVDGEQDAAGAVPADVQAAENGGEGEYAHDLEFVIEGVDRQVGHEFVLADNRSVVEDEGSQHGHEGVLNQRYFAGFGDLDVSHHEEGNEDDEDETGEGDLWFCSELLVLEIVPVHSRVDRGELVHHWFGGLLLVEFLLHQLLVQSLL